MLNLPTITFAPTEGDVDPETTLPVSLDALIRSRLMIEANSGAGKSWLIRTMLEGTFGRVQQIVIDPEGEYFTLRERYDYLLVGVNGDLPADPSTARLLARQLMELQASAVIDVSELTLDMQRRYVRDLLSELMLLPSELRRPVLITIDEANLFVPQGTKCESSEAVIDVCRRGRKRGLCPVLAFQRLSAVDKDAVSMLQNKLIGQTVLANDVRRVVQELGLDKGDEHQLKILDPGQFFAFGPAISRHPLLARTGAVETVHPDGNKLADYIPPPAPEAIASLLRQMQELAAPPATEADPVSPDKKSAPDSLDSVEKIVTVEKIVERVVEKRVEVPVYLLRDGEMEKVQAAIDELRALAKDIPNALMLHAQELENVLSLQRGEFRSSQRASAAATSVPEMMLEQPAPAPEPAPLTIADALPANMEANEEAEERAEEQAEEAPAAPDPAALEPTKTPRRALPGKPSVSRPQQEGLNALALLYRLGVAAPARDVIAFFRGVRADTGSFKSDLTALKTAGLVAFPSPGQVALTADGLEAAQSVKVLPTRADLHRAWLAKLSGPQAETLRLLIDQYPQVLTRADIARVRGVKAETGSFKGDLTTLRSLGLVQFPAPGQVVAADLLFPKGLT